jgi:hypothetical protein
MTTMNFGYFDLTTVGRERQQELIAAAAERRLIRQAMASHPSSGRFARMFRRHPAS